MRRARNSGVGLTLLRTVVVLGLACGVSWSLATVRAQTQPGGAPTFTVDPSWPEPLPNTWVIGTVASIAVDSRDHVWILHRPTTVSADELTDGQEVAPPVIEFDPEGNVVQAWGGPGAGYDWMVESTADYPRGSPAEHGIFVDHEDHVWVTGNGDVVLKFTRTGQFLMQIGQHFETGGSNDTRLFGNPSDMAVHPGANELFVGDGYLNRRVIVFDTETGAYKRHWGAYGARPDDGPAVNYEPDQPLPRQFFVVHCVQLSRDGLVYVCDRQRNRVQVFERDGTFVDEVVIAKDTPAGAGITLRGSLSDGITRAGVGSAFRVGFSADPEQQYLYVAGVGKIWIVRRSDLHVLGSFDAGGTHHMAGADSKGNLYTTGREKPERFLYQGETSSTLDR